MWGSLGLAVATSTAVGALLTRVVRARRLGIVAGMLLLTVSSLLCPFIIIAAFEAAERFTLIEWSGADSWSNLGLLFLAALWGCFALLVFAVFLAVASGRARNESN